MNADRVLALYERVSDSPDAVGCLRRFVLDLAVRGKLVEQNPADEPAKELLERIAAEKARLVEAGEIRRHKVLSNLDERPFSLPETWRWARVREITTDRGQEVPDRPFTYIDVSAIDKENGLVVGPRLLEPDQAPSRARKIARPGDVVYSSVRPYLLNVAVIEGDFDPRPIVSTAFEVLNGHGFVLPRYIWIVLRSPFMVASVQQRQRGQAYPAINTTDFAVLPFPLPPLAEQHRIVAKVDQLMALCERLEETRAAREDIRNRLTKASHARLTATDTDVPTFRAYARVAIAVLPTLTARADQIKQLRQAILDLAVRGKLVEQDPVDEPASELLKRITEIRVQLGVKHEVKPLSANETPFRLPVGWHWSRIGELCTKTGSGSTPRGGKSVYKEIGVPFLRSQNVYDDGLRLADVAFVGSGVHARMAGTAVRAGDLLLNITGGSIGRCCRVPDDFSEANVNQHVAIIRPAVSEMADYLHKLVLSPYFQAFIFSEQTGAGRGGLPKNRMDRIAVAVPPLVEQHRIVAKFNELMTLCDRLETGLASTDGIRGDLLESLLREAPPKLRLLEGRTATPSSPRR